MPASASTLRQKVRISSARPAESYTSLDVYRQILSRALAGVFASAVPSTVTRTVDSKDAFEAVRHVCALSTPNLSIAEPEDSFVALRSVVAPGERYRGKHGKLAVIRK
jgi:hypothetical protein